jgi:hypothetical protein
LANQKQELPVVQRYDTMSYFYTLGFQIEEMYLM